jgi:hypothetical protein
MPSLRARRSNPEADASVDLNDFDERPASYRLRELRIASLRSQRRFEYAYLISILKMAD